MALSYAVWAVSHSFVLFVVARIIGGLSKGNISVSTAVVADVTTPEKRSKGMVRQHVVVFGMSGFRHWVETWDRGNTANYTIAGIEIRHRSWDPQTIMIR